MVKNNYLKRIYLSNEISNQRITDTVENISFRFSADLLDDIRKGLFTLNDGYRKCNLSKSECVMHGHSFIYADFNEIPGMISHAFERANNTAQRFGNLTPDQAMSQTLDFVSEIWKIHPYSDGNTRISATLIQIYMKHLGYNVRNALFAKYPMTFRNCLIHHILCEQDSGFSKTFLNNAFCKNSMGKRL